MRPEDVAGPIKEVAIPIMGVAEDIDKRVFGEKTLRSRLLKGYIVMAILVFLLPTILERLFSLVGLPYIFYAAIMPTAVFAIILGFVYFTIVEIVGPIKELLIQIRKIQTGDLVISLPPGGYQEAERLVAAVGRLRNSLQIAVAFLGERKSGLDKNILGELVDKHLTLRIFFSYMLYGILVIWVSGVMYSQPIYDFFSSFPYPWLVQFMLVVTAAIVMAMALGFHITGSVGTPINGLSQAAERISVGDYGVEFPRGLKGELAEIADHLTSIKEAIMTAEREMESELGGGGETPEEEGALEATDGTAGEVER